MTVCGGKPSKQTVWDATQAFRQCLFVICQANATDKRYTNIGSAENTSYAHSLVRVPLCVIADVFITTRISLSDSRACMRTYIRWCHIDIRYRFIKPASILANANFNRSHWNIIDSGYQTLVRLLTVMSLFVSGCKAYRQHFHGHTTRAFMK